jgi:hypothetical protein
MPRPFGPCSTWPPRSAASSRRPPSVAGDVLAAAGRFVDRRARGSALGRRDDARSGAASQAAGWRGCGALVIATYRDDELGCDLSLRVVLGDVWHGQTDRASVVGLVARGPASVWRWRDRRRRTARGCPLTGWISEGPRGSRRSLRHDLRPRASRRRSRGAFSPSPARSRGARRLPRWSGRRRPARGSPPRAP